MRVAGAVCLLLREALTVGRISFHKHFHSTEMNAGEAKAAVDEMNNYCVVTEAPKTTFGKVPEGALKAHL